MICRLCLDKSEEFLEIFADDGKLVEGKVVEVIENHFQIVVQFNDNVSNKICIGCWQYLNEFHQFWLRIKKKQQTLQKDLASARIKNEDATACEQINSTFEYKNPTLCEPELIINDIKKETDVAAEVEMDDAMNDGSLLLPFDDTEAMEWRKYKVHSDQDRSRVVEAANRDDDWIGLAVSLGIKYKTAYSWVRSGRDKKLKRGGVKAKSLTVYEVDHIVRWIEENCTLTLKEIKMKVCNAFQKEVSVTTIGNYLQGRLYTIKDGHHQIATINSDANKTKRAEYVRALNTFLQAGKQIIYMDETNFNFFCRRTRGRARSGCRSVQILPAARGPNIHLIAAITTSGIIAMEHRRGSFKPADTCNWLQIVLQKWVEMGNNPADLVLVCDNAPCHAHLENALNSFNATDKATLLRLVPYSPILNPLEIIWSKIKTYVKVNIGIPTAFGTGVVEQELSYLEHLIDEAKTTIGGDDCASAIQHTASFHPNVLSLVDMPVGT